MSESRVTEKALQLLRTLESHRGVLEFYMKHPQRLLFLLDVAPQWASRKILSLASGVVDPHLFAKGLVVEDWSPTQVGVALPNRWIHRWGGKAENLSHVFSMAQLSLRLYWEWQQGLDAEPMEIKQFNWESLQRGAGGLKARYRVEPEARDQILFFLQRDGHMEFDVEVLILDHREVIIGVIRGFIALKGPKYLP